MDERGKTCDYLTRWAVFPGEIIQAPDGRIAAVWMQRYPYEDSEIRMRISHDLGETWSKNTYSLMKGQGLPSSIVYPDGTVVTVAENTKLDSQGKVISERTMAAVQWKMPEEIGRQPFAGSRTRITPFPFIH